MQTEMIEIVKAKVKLRLKIKLLIIFKELIWHKSNAIFFKVVLMKMIKCFLIFNNKKCKVKEVQKSFHHKHMLFNWCQKKYNYWNQYW